MNKKIRLIAGLLAASLCLLPLCCGLLSLGTFAAVDVWPALGATAVDQLRGVFGDALVAEFEDFVLNAQDSAKRLAYQVDKNGTKVGWDSAAAQPASNSAWTPAPATALGGKPGEAEWQPFITSGGHVVAYRMFLAPDPQRPYAYAAFIAFDTSQTRLHFLLGSEEPKSDLSLARSGRIPSADRQPGTLLAAFNGGFKAEHGHFGAMVDGITVLPPQPGSGAVGIYDDGTVRIGMLGQDVLENKHLLAWRQNGPLVIQTGQINPLANSSDPQDWGYVVSVDTATNRSALGISQDGRSLYYVVGPDLTLPALARALQAAGAYQAIQLDINNYWAHFSTFTPTPDGLKAIPLLDFMKGVDDQRFLHGYIRDYFYVTTP